MDTIIINYRNEVIERDIKLGRSDIYEYMTNEPLGASMTIKFNSHKNLLKFNDLMIDYNKMVFVCFGDDNYSISKYYVMTIPGETNSMLKFQEVNPTEILVKRVNPAIIIKNLSKYNILYNEYNKDLLKFRHYKSYMNRLIQMKIDNTGDVLK